MHMKKGEEDELITIHGIRMGFPYWSGHFLLYSLFSLPGFSAETGRVSFTYKNVKSRIRLGKPSYRLEKYSHEQL